MKADRPYLGQEEQMTAAKSKVKVCPVCEAGPGQFHKEGCDNERCAKCGTQRVSCEPMRGCDGVYQPERIAWSGREPGEAECEQYGYYSKIVPEKGWVACDKDDPDAQPDLNRLIMECVWDRQQKRYVKPDKTKLTAQVVERITVDCLFRDDEDTADAVMVSGITRQYGFHPKRLAEHKPEIVQLLSQLDPKFHQTEGGHSFMYACVTKNGDHWGEQPDAENLLCLGLAVGKIDMMPRQFWTLLPGNVPYFFVKP